MKADAAPAYRRPHRVRFSECDPAGIVFFPQYFVMLNGLIEEWFDEGLRLRYRDVLMKRRIGLPTVRLEANFTAISTFGDDVILQLQVVRLGQRSITLEYGCTSAQTGEQRMIVHQTIVTTSLEKNHSIDIPADIRLAIERFMQEGN